ncbi:hypothetical protein [Paenibacillus koleovorans]|uniref:hypothetical protein n=1 Tax=Paenibacillus koleovorans TaxID=121608 RepID=UPI000FD96A8D|nr:hypothetical protein [Paenibacillus koleovorans]
MLVGLLLILGSYGSAIALVHFCHSVFRWNRKKPLTYLLITKNNGLHMEWYLRSLLLFSWFKGRKVNVLLLDEGSTDDTVAIASRLAADRPNEMQVMKLEDSALLDDIIACYEHEEVVLVRLSNEPEMQKLPIAQ